MSRVLNESHSVLRNKAIIEELGLSLRTYNALRRGGFHYKEELMTCSDKDILSLRNIGKSNLNEIRNALGVHQIGQNSIYSSWSFDQQQRQSQAYDLLIKVENIIRQFIYHHLKSQHGEEWWIGGIPKNIQKQVSRRIHIEIFERPTAEVLEFVDFGEYRSIINANWGRFFSKFLSSKVDTMKHLVRINSLRRTIAHSRPIDPKSFRHLCEEVTFIRKTFRVKRRN